MSTKAPKKQAKKSDNGVVYRTIHGTAVRFYKRSAGSNYTMDFEVMGERIQESTKWPTMADAERVADRRVREVKERKQGLEAQGLGHQKAKGKFASVGDVIAAMDGGSKVWGDGTLRVYKSSLLRLARVINAEDPEAVAIDAALKESTIERMYADGQGLAAPNWADALDENGGLNSTVRNVKAIFGKRPVKLKFTNLKLPDLRQLREATLLRCEVEGFVPWEVSVYDRMHAASELLRADPAKAELWLVNAMLRRLGVRDEELASATDQWIEWQAVDLEPGQYGPRQMRGWLRIQNRGNEFAVLKHGRFRKLELDAELVAVLWGREGHLIAPGWSESARYDLIYRTHNQWLRQFIPDRVKGNHELRMHAGSIVYTVYGLEAAAVFLGHKSVTTTEKYYAAWLSESPKVDAAMVAKARVVKLAA